MPRRSRSYKTDLYEQLQDRSEALTYLQVALEESVPAFLKALKNVLEARNISKVAEQSGLNRVNLYRMLGDNGNPQLKSLTSLLQVLGVRLSVEPIEAAETVDTIEASEAAVVTRSNASAEATFEFPVIPFPAPFRPAAVTSESGSVDTKSPVSTLTLPVTVPMYSKDRVRCYYA